MRDRNDIVNKKFVAEFMKQQWDRIEEEVENESDVAVGNLIWNKIDKRLHVSRRFYRLKVVSSVAASVAILFLAGWTYFMWGNRLSDEMLIVEAAESRNYILPDGSKVWMEAGSRIECAGDFSENRNVKLEGNSTFEVLKQNGKPFRVYLANSCIEVKGTCFSVNQDIAEANVITLYNGRIDFISAGKEAVELYPSQQLVYDSVKLKSTVKPISSNICWENGDFRFSEIALSELVDFIGQKYRVSIELEGLKKLNITGRIHYDETLDLVIKKICFSLKLNYRFVNNKYVLYK